jgi:hypothetical protein
MDNSPDRQLAQKRGASLTTATDCNLCALRSWQNHEQPIGTADPVNEWLFVEVPRPWKDNPWARPEYKPLVDLVESLVADRDRYFKTRLQAIVPDHRQDNNHIRIIHYKAPAPSFSQYQRQEYCLPIDQAAPLASALLFFPNQLEAFGTYRQMDHDLRDLFVCTHTDYDVACGRFGAPIYQQLRQRANPNLRPNLRLWQVNHFGGHQFAPTLLDFPTGRWWGHLLPETIEGLLNCDQLSGPDLQDFLTKHYRGWSGSAPFCQFLEQAVWADMGPAWAHLDRTTELLQYRDPSPWQTWLRPLLQQFPLGKRLLQSWNRRAIGATVALKFTHPTQGQLTYRAKVTQVSTVKTQMQSGPNLLVDRPQYHLTLVEMRIR